MEKEKPIIITDFDGFKFHTTEAHVAFFNHFYKIQISIEECAGHQAWDTVINRYLTDKHVTLNDIYVDATEHFYGSIDWHATIVPLEGMASSLKRLTEKYKLITVSAREKSSVSVIEHFLNKYMPGCISEIYCMYKYVGNGKFEGMSKREFIENYPGKKIAFLDDTPSEILDTQDIIPSYLFDPLGYHDGDTRILHRVKSPEEIEKLFL